MSVRPAMIALAVCLTAGPAAAQINNPLTFFVGRTESIGIIRLAMKKPFRSRAIGKGELKPDGSLHLVQRVEDEGELPRERRWHMRPAGPGRFTGTMSEAKGPVQVEQVGGRYRFRFRMDHGVSVEQWLIPMEEGRWAVSKLTIRKYGVKVGSSNGTIRRLD